MTKILEHYQYQTDGSTDRQPAPNSQASIRTFILFQERIDKEDLANLLPHSCQHTIKYLVLHQISNISTQGRIVRFNLI